MLVDLLAGASPIQIALVIGLGVSTVCYLVGLYSAGEFFRLRPDQQTDAVDEPVTVLRPLKGLEAGLYENLETLCAQRYGTFQLVCGVADAQDPAVAVVRRLQREHPELDIHLVVDGSVCGANYKISNLHNMYRHAKHDIIVFADSDIRVGPDYLRRVVTGLRDPKVGLVTCLYRAVNRGKLPTLIESLFINTDFAPLVMVARKVERATYAFGATIAMRRQVLDEIGGFLPLANCLADDYQLGQRVTKRGYDLALSREVVDTVLAIGSWRALLEHQLRWARTYRICRPGGYFGSIITHGTSWAVLNVLYHQFSSASVLTSLAVIGLRYISAVTMSWRYLKADTAGLQMLLVGPKDLFVSAVWFMAFLGSTVTWSGHRFRVERNGDMVDITPSAPPLPQPWQPDSYLIESKLGAASAEAAEHRAFSLGPSWASQPMKKRTERSATAITGAQYTPSTTVSTASTPSSAPLDQSRATVASPPLGKSRNIVRTTRA